jgi:hypothetical protein
VDKVIPAVIVAVILIVALALMVLGWRARQRRQITLPEPHRVPAALGAVLGEFETFYVATTMAGDPLNRVAVQGLGFRAKAFVVVTTDGVIVPIDGQPDIFIPVADIRDVSLATWTIDRVVERDGLILIAWTLGDTGVDSYFRAEEPQGFLGALTSLRSTIESDSQ